MASFNSNSERLQYLESLLKTGQSFQFEKQAWEWIHTNVFTREEFARVLYLKWSQGYDEGAEYERNDP